MQESERRKIEEQYANWHAPTTEAEHPREIETSSPQVEINSEDVLKYVQNNEKENSPEAKRRNAARRVFEKFYPIVQNKIKEVGLLISQGKTKEAESAMIEGLNAIKQESNEFLVAETEAYFSEYDEHRTKAEVNTDPQEKKRLYKLALEGLNFIPVIGSAKMIGEGIAGQSISGEKLAKGKKLLHLVEGTVFLTLDLTGVGALASRGMKAGKLVTRTSALMRKTGMASEVYKPMFKFGKYLLENSAASKVADQSFKYILNQRNKRIETLSEESKKITFSLIEQEEELTNTA